jgi:hypothetical protein
MQTVIRKRWPVYLLLGMLTLAADASTAQAQQRGRSRTARRPTDSMVARRNQMMQMFYAQQARNWALLDRGRASAPAPTYGGVRTGNPFDGTNVRRPPTAPSYPGGYRGRWYNPFGTGRDNNVFGPSPYNGRSRYFYDPNATKRAR